MQRETYSERGGREMRERKLGRDIEKREIEIDIERYSEIERGQTEKWGVR